VANKLLCFSLRDADSGHSNTMWVSSSIIPVPHILHILSWGFHYTCDESTTSLVIQVLLQLFFDGCYLERLE